MDFPIDPQDAGGPDPDQDLVAGEQSDSEKVAEKLQMFGASLAKRRAEWVRARAAAGHDKRWAEDLDQYNGKDATNRAASQMMTSVEQGFPVTTQNAKPSRSTVFVQVTRQKTNALAAREGDILLPTDERNFGIAPTPVPTLPTWMTQPVQPGQTPAAPPAASAPPMPSAGPSGAPPSGASGGAMTDSGAPPIGGPQQAAAAAPGGAPGTPGGPGAQTPLTATSIIAAPPLTPAAQQLLNDQHTAKIGAEAMQLEIEDKLDECDYNGECRKVVFNKALFGSGVMKGPVVINRVSKSWQKKTDVMGNPIWTLEMVTALDPASFNVDPRNFWPDPACGEDIQDGRGSFELNKKTPKQVRELGKQPAYIKSQLAKVIEEGPSIGRGLDVVSEMEDRDIVSDEIFEHWIYWGEVEREDLIAAGVAVSDDTLEVVSACVEMINSTVVRAYMNPLARAQIPYDMVPCERIPGSCYGYGVPYLMRSQQRVINAAWRMILDNAGVSSGPQIVVNPNVIQPADKNWALTSRKIWYANDDVDDVRKAFATFEFASHQQELTAIIEMADKLSDQETAVPMLTQGQQGSAPETVGGMQMLMNSANVMLRRLVKQFDDKLTKPHIRRYYDYLMEYSDKDDIKGDYQIIALGSSSLVVKDIQNQGIHNLLALGANPAFAPLINLKKLFAMSLKADHIDPADIMNTDAEIAQAQQIAAQNQQPDPKVQVAQLVQKSTDNRTQAMVQMNDETLKTKEATALEDVQMRRQELQVERELEIMRIARDQNISINEVKAQLAGTAMQVRAKQDMQANEIQLKDATGSGI